MAHCIPRNDALWTTREILRLTILVSRVLRAKWWENIRWLRVSDKSDGHVHVGTRFDQKIRRTRGLFESRMVLMWLSIVIIDGVTRKLGGIKGERTSDAG